jgi:hypothetical protein
MATIESVARTQREHERLATCVQCGRRVDQDHRHVRDEDGRKWHLSCVQTLLGRISDRRGGGTGLVGEALGGD